MNESILGSGEADLVPIAHEYDESSLAEARTRWLFGEWNSLAELDLQRLKQHPDRARFALLVASAHQQLGKHDAALKSARLAVSWGCDKQLVARVLVAGVHNTLGRACALANKEHRAIRHFKASVVVGESAGGSAELMGHARSVREVTKLGLLPQAAALMEQSLSEASRGAERPQQSKARLKMLEAEVELLRGELILAAQRGQLYAGNTTRSPGDSSAQAEAGPTLDELRRLSTSQLGQDIWVLEKTGFKRNGYFVEIGATDGVLLSNTYLLEKSFGWKGVCAEPQPAFFEQLRKNRECDVSDACIAGESGRIAEFILAGEYGGLADFAGNDLHADKRQAFLSLGKTIQVTTKSLDDFLEAHNAPREIDYLSIDTEGSEYEILRTFPFDKWRIRCISVEHNFSPTREPVRELLEPLGYRRQETQWDDWYHLSSER
jgi:FkbM family methyltransferase